MESINGKSKTGKNLLIDILRKKNLLSFYFTAGYPEVNSTTDILLHVQNTGVDFVEVGFPFSDPIADGPVIQESSTAALRNGMNLHLLLDQLIAIREEILIPIILMGYLNPVLQFGIEEFCKRCQQAGVAGLILPDLPITEFERKYKKIFDAYNLSIIFLITPQTSVERIIKIDSITESFIYAVSSSSTTGAKDQISDDQKEYLCRVRDLNLQNPVIVGFGISNHSSYSDVIQYSNGAIIGSAFISFLAKGPITEMGILEFVKKIRSER